MQVKVVGHDEADAQLLAKLWRFMLYKDHGPHVAWTTLQQVEHEAYMMSLARNAGVNAPHVLVAGTAGSKAALLATRPVPGTPLAEHDAEVVDDGLHASIWGQLTSLHGAHIVHGALDGQHVLIHHRVPYLIGFDHAVSIDVTARAATDHAQLLVATAVIVGPAHAVDAAARMLEPGQLAAALPLLQPAALGTSSRQPEISPQTIRDLLRELRELAAAATGIQTPPLKQVHRFRPASVLMTVGTLIAVAALLTSIGAPSQVWHTVRHANGWWLACAGGLALASNIGYAIGLQGTVAIPLPLGPTTELQLAMSSANLAIPGIGGMGLQVRYLQGLGLDLPDAATAGGLLSSIGNVVAAVGLFVLAVAIEPADVDLRELPLRGVAVTILSLMVLSAVGTALVSAIPRLRGALVLHLRKTVSTVVATLRSPRLVALMLGGYTLAILLSTWALTACLLAFNGHTSFWALLTANIGVVTIASLIPVPGGSTAVGTVGLAALLVSFGVPNRIAVAAVLANQLISYYLPAIPGWFATQHLIRHDYL